MHCDPEDLGLLALGEDVDVDSDHLRTCRHCGAELESLRAVVGAARSGVPERVTPPARVWQAIAAETGLDMAAGTAPPSGPGRSGRAASGRRWTTWALAAAAVAGILAGAGAVTALTAGNDAADGTPVAVADLEPLGAAPAAGSATGSARLLARDGSDVLRLSTTGLPDDAEGYYQVWLLDSRAERLVALGVLTGAEGTFVVPAGVDPEDYPVVDVSVEPLDGDPAHSGDSLLRGTLGS